MNTCFSLQKDTENYPASFLENNLYPISFYFPTNLQNSTEYIFLLTQFKAALYSTPCCYFTLLVSQCNYAKNTYNRKIKI